MQEPGFKATPKHLNGHAVRLNSHAASMREGERTKLARFQHDLTAKILHLGWSTVMRSAGLPRPNKGPNGAGD